MKEIDYTEWNIILHSGQCAYIIEIWNNNRICNVQCNHPENSSQYCHSTKCPIKEKK